MSFKATLLGALTLLTALLLSFNFVYKQFTVPWAEFFFQSDFMQVLEQAENDQKRLAALDPEHEIDYREHFGYINDLHSNLQVLKHNQQNLQSTLKRVYLFVFIFIFSLALIAYLLHQRYVRTNLDTLRVLIERLLEKRDTPGESVKGIFRTMELMVRDVTAMMGRKNLKLKTLSHLSNWQESARRHAHEIKTPLTACRLELERLDRTLEPELTEAQRHQWHLGRDNLYRELDRLKTFTIGFSSFGKINKPRLKRQNLVSVLADFVDIYQGAWPNLALSATFGQEELILEFDTDLIRQVWTNLIQNSAQALGEKTGMAEFIVDRTPSEVLISYRDNGPGVPPEIAGRIFEPYVTSKKIGEGMGLGLAISKKIMLDHGGDLELKPSEKGVDFTMSFPLMEQE